jgi:hypothetical protein
MLGEAFGDQASFVSLNGTIRLVFTFENPYAFNWTMTMVMELMTKCRSPSELKFQNSWPQPSWVMSCLLIGVGFNQLRDIIDKILMSCYIPSDGVASARRDWGKSAKSKQGSIVSLVIFEVRRVFGRAGGLANR